MVSGGGSLGSAVLDLTVNDTEFEKGLDSSHKSLGGFKTFALGAGLAVAAGIGVIGAAALKIGGDFDSAYDTIRLGTGKTGDVLSGLEDDFRAAFADVPADMATVSTAIADLNTRMGLTGQPLQALTKQFVNLGRITETDVAGNIADATRVFGDWGVAVEDSAGTLDMLFRATQESGIGFGSLSNKLVQFGAPLRSMGFSIEESTALLAKWEKEGVNTELVLGSMRIAMGKFAKDNVPMRQGLDDTIATIQEMGPGAEAMTLAMEVFGARAGPDMAAAILEGRFAIDDYMAAIEGGSETINGAASDTDDWQQSLDRLKNKGLLLIEPIASSVFNSMGALIENVLLPAMDGLIRIVNGIGPAFTRMGEAITMTTSLFGVDMQAIVNGLIWFKENVIGAVTVFLEQFGGIQGIIASVRAWVQSFIDFWIEIFEMFQENPARALGKLTSELVGFAGWVATTLLHLLISAFALIVQGIIAVVAALPGLLLNILLRIPGVILGALAFLRDFLLGFFEGLITEELGQIAGYIPGLFGHALERTWETIKSFVQPFLNIFGFLRDNLLDIWRNLTGSIGGMWDTTWSNIRNGFRGFVNAIIDGMNGLIRGLNKIGFDVPDWVPLIGGKSWGFNVAEIPRMAQGGITRGGPILTGERGMELLIPPAGSRVFSAPETESILGGARTIEQNITFNGPVSPRQAAREMDRALRRLIFDGGI